jgi:hypothetical protein
MNHSKKQKWLLTNEKSSISPPRSKTVLFFWDALPRRLILLSYDSLQR